MTKFWAGETLEAMSSKKPTLSSSPGTADMLIV